LSQRHLALCPYTTLFRSGGNQLDIQEKVMNRLIGYAKIDTQSDESSQETPTTEGQLKLGKHLVAELQKIGMEDVTMDDNGYVMRSEEHTSELQSRFDIVC